MSASKEKAKSKGDAPPKRKTTKTKAKVTKPKKVAKKALAAKPKKAAPEQKPKKAVIKAKKKEKKEKKKAPPKTTVKVERVKLGPPPVAMVAVRHIDSLHERTARGFSFGELASAGIPLNAAKREDLSLDIRRRSVVERNVEMLKGWFKSPEDASARDEAKPVVSAAK